LQAEGGYSEAAKLCGEVLEVRRRVLGPNHPATAASIYCLARNAALQGENDAAIPLLREAVGHGLPQEAARGIENDIGFRSLQKDARFEELVSEIRQHDPGPVETK